METNKKTKTLAIVILVKGIMLTVLGVIHTLASFIEYDAIKGEMSGEMARQYILWFYALGLFLLFVGLLDLLTYKGIQKNMSWAWRNAFLSALFSIVTGLSGLIGLQWALSPPYIIVLTGIVPMILLLCHKKEFKLP